MGLLFSPLRALLGVAPARPTLYLGGNDTVVPTSPGDNNGAISLFEFVQKYVPSLAHDYTPAWWIPTGHGQTLYCVLGKLSKQDPVVYERKLLRLPDGGTLGLDFTAGHDKLPEDTPIIVVKHGLTGGSYESYVRSILARACKPVHQGGLGLRGVVCTFRGCAGVPATSPQFYSAGHTDDLRIETNFIRTLYPKARLIGLGFSLGANVVTRYVGQEGDKSRLCGAIVLACPWDLVDNSFHLEGRWLNREVYSKAMGRNIVRLFGRHIKALKSLPDSPQMQHIQDVGLIDKLEDKNWVRGKRLIDVDEVIVANVGGSPKPHGPFPFKSAMEYYKWASSHQALPGVRVPLLAINSVDDPIVHKFPKECGDNPYVCLAVTRHGGHLGWFQDDGTRWVVQPVLEFISALSKEINHTPGSNEPPINSTLDAEGFIREADPERAHLGWKLLKDGELVVADRDPFDDTLAAGL